MENYCVVASVMQFFTNNTKKMRSVGKLELYERVMMYQCLPYSLIQWVKLGDYDNNYVMVMVIL